jgi:hypothetical protein
LLPELSRTLGRKGMVTTPCSPCETDFGRVFIHGLDDAVFATDERGVVSPTRVEQTVPVARFVPVAPIDKMGVTTQGIRTILQKLIVGSVGLAGFV